MVGIEKVTELNFANLVQKTLAIHKQSEPQVNVNIGRRIDTNCPLRLWNDSVEKLTYLSKEVDVKPVYRALINRVNEKCYDK